MVEWLKILLRIPEIPGSYLCPETRNSDRVFFVDFLSLPALALPSKSFSNDNPLITLSFDAI
jgi:hypothetical protein